MSAHVFGYMSHASFPVIEAMNRKIWILWLQGFEDAPYIVKKCLNSWEKHNSDTWEIVRLTEENIGHYIDLETLVPDLKSKTVSNASYSDLIRIELLSKFGGLWVDATAYCSKPLDSWLVNHISDGFFAFQLASDRPLASWFLYGEPKNYIIERWRAAAVDYINSHTTIGSSEPHTSLEEWRNRTDHTHYFWFHYLFGDLIAQDHEFRRQWGEIEKLSGHPPHLVQRSGMLKPATDEVIAAVQSKAIPVYKLTHRHQEPIPEDSNLNFLLQH